MPSPSLFSYQLWFDFGAYVNLFLYPTTLQWLGIMVSCRTSLCLSVCPFVFCFRTITWVNIMDFHQTWYTRALILWRSGLGLSVIKFHQCFTELSAHDMIMAWYSSLTFLFLCMSFVYSLLLFVHFRLCCGEMGCSLWKYRGCYQGFFKTIKNCQQSEDLTSYKLKEAGERL